MVEVANVAGITRGTLSRIINMRFTRQQFINLMTFQSCPRQMFCELFGPLVGLDAALSTMQMPPGVPVGCMAIGAAGAINAAIYAAEILATSNAKLAASLKRFKKAQADKVASKDADVRKKL